MDIYEMTNLKTYSCKDLYDFYHMDKKIRLNTPHGMKEVVGAYMKTGAGVRLLYDDDTETVGAEHHLIRMKGEFTPMCSISVEDRIEKWGGGYKTVVGKEHIPNETWYDFSLDYEHECYIQNDIVHHNSGKSAIISGIARYLQTIFEPQEKVLIVVPNINLVNQFAYDLCDYFSTDLDWLKTDPIHTIFAGQEKNVSSQIIVSTWQSLHKMPKEYFEQFRCLIVDECHLSESKGFTSICEKCKNAEYRFGFSGSVKNSKVHVLTLEGMFGKSHITKTTKELMDEGSVTELDIKGVLIKYPPEVCNQQRKINDYSAELEYIVTNEDRNKFICKMALSQKGNGLILVDKVDKHAKPLLRMLKEIAGDRPVFYITGEVKGKVREEIRLDMDNYDNAIIVSNFQCLSTGANIPTLNWLIFGSPTKSYSRVIQSIGRILRLHKSKTLVTLFDIIDDMRIKPKTAVHENYAWKHALERLNFYSEQKFDVQMRKVPLFVKD